MWPTPWARSTFCVFLFHPKSPTTPRKARDGLGSPDVLGPLQRCKSAVPKSDAYTL
jgi:hypothetical protein